MNGRKEKDNDREERRLKDRQKIKDRVQTKQSCTRNTIGQIIGTDNFDDYIKIDRLCNFSES